MAVIVNTDLVIPAVLNMSLYKIINGDSSKELKDKFLSMIALSPESLVKFADRMKCWDLGRVVRNFDSMTALNILRQDANLKELGRGGQFVIDFPKDVDKEQYLKKLIGEYLRPINYSPRVLRTCGLLSIIR